jgi:nucleotide-binding universal stress UspA family protein
MYQHILVPLNSSRHSEQILAQLPPVVWQHRSSVQLLSVYPPMRAVAGGQQTSVYAHQLESQASVEALRSLDRMAMRLQARGLSVSTEVRFGDPVEIILATDQASATDCIIMPVPWCRCTGRLMTADVTTQVIRTSPVPVLVVRLEARQSPRGKRLGTSGRSCSVR